MKEEQCSGALGGRSQAGPSAGALGICPSQSKQRLTAFLKMFRYRLNLSMNPRNPWGGLAKFCVRKKLPQGRSLLDRLIVVSAVAAGAVLLPYKKCLYKVRI